MSGRGSGIRYQKRAEEQLGGAQIHIGVKKANTDKRGIGPLAPKTRNRSTGALRKTTD